MKFTKMQGIGNDYIYVNCFRETVPDPARLSIRISDRHFGVGSDGLVLILPGDRADFRMRMFNADGSEAEMCGNASRCVAKYVWERGLTRKTDITLETGAGIKRLHLNIAGDHVSSVRVDMGVPELSPARIPVAPEVLGLREDAPEVLSAPLRVDDRVFSVTCVATGNPHCVTFLDDVDSFPLELWGPKIENHPAFPRRVNTEFVRVIDRGHLRMRVWERGSGETLACGTGACASLTAAVLNGLCDRKAVLHLNGGDLEIEWQKETGHLLMTGPAEFVFDGEIA